MVAVVATSGTDLRYNPNASKIHLVVKPELVDEAKRILVNTNGQISTNGQRHLGAAVGTREFITRLYHIQDSEFGNRN